MPYIKKEERDKYEPTLSELKSLIESATPKGNLTYLLYAISLDFIKKGGKSYTNISTAISCLNDAAEEMRRKHLNPYEDKKILENGDIE